MTIKEEEQYYLDKVLGSIDKKINEVKNEQISLAQEIEDIGIPDKEDASHLRKTKEKLFETNGKIYKLECSKDSPHFGRMDLRLKDQNNVESLTMYIGEKLVNDSEHNILVYDWRSPVANLYYMNNQTAFKYNEYDYDLLLKRQIEIQKAKLLECFDTFRVGEKENVTDVFLQKILNDKKNRNEFVDIIRTIQSEQNIIIRDEPFLNQIVQGVAGSGKTVVLLHRLSYLLYNYSKILPSKYIYITPSKEFQDKLYTINRSLSLHDIQMCTIEEYYLNKINLLLPNIKIKEILKDEINNKALKEIYSDEFNNVIKNYINNYFEDFISKLKKINMNIGNNFYSSINTIITIIKKKLDDEDYNTLDERDLYNELLNEARTLIKRDSIKKITDNIYQYLIDNYPLNKAYMKSGKCNKFIAYIMLNIYTKLGFENKKQYEIMFIDEMQDYSNNEFRCLDILEKNPYINLYGDINQNILWYIEPKSKDQLISLIKELNCKEINYYELNENYRNSKQVANYVNQFISTKMIPMGIESKDVATLEVSNEELINQINTYPKETVFISSNQKLLDTIKEKGYECYNVVTAKGMEFSNVVVINNELNNIDKYIAYTRTLNQLYIYNIK